MLAGQQRTGRLPPGTGRRGPPWWLSSGRVSRYCLSHTPYPCWPSCPELIQQVGHDLHGKVFRHRGPDPHKAGLTASTSQHPVLVLPGQQPVTAGDRLGRQGARRATASRNSHRRHSG